MQGLTGSPPELNFGHNMVRSQTIIHQQEGRAVIIHFAFNGLLSGTEYENFIQLWRHVDRLLNCFPHSVFIFAEIYVQELYARTNIFNDIFVFSHSTKLAETTSLNLYRPIV